MSDDKYFEEGEYFTPGDIRKVNQGSQPKVDEAVSKVVGKVIYVNNPILIKKVAEWKKAAGNKDVIVENGKFTVPAPDNFLDDPEKIKELKEIL